MIEKADGFRLIVLFLFFIVSIGFSQDIHASVEASAIETKHIFSPDPDPKETPKTETSVNNVEQDKLLKKLDQQLLFTGIVRSAGEPKVLIREKRSKSTLDDYALSVGDEILEMSVKEIGRNYVILTGQGGDVRLNLFKSRADRPVAPKVEAPSPEQPAADKEGSGEAPKGSAAASTASGRKNSDGQDDAADSDQPSAVGGDRDVDGDGNPDSAPVDPSEQMKNNPLYRALQNKGRVGGSDQAQQAIPEGANPFLEAIRRARERQ